MVVKGSKQYKTRVVTYQPGREVMRAVRGALLVMAFGAICWWFGYRQAGYGQQLALAEWDDLSALVQEQELQIQQLNAHISNTEVSVDVDKQAMETLRREIVQLNEKIALLEESNDFYRKLMEPKSATQGLAIGSFTLTPSPGGDEYHYQLVVQQFAKDPRVIKGRVNVTVIGKQGEENKTYPLHEVSDQVEEVDIPFKFRFYQSFEGNLILPDEFELQRVDVLAEKSGSTAPVVRSFDWQSNADQTH